MKLIVPDYYPNFRCIAGNCRHSCCIGWEIDIDPHKLTYYRSIQDPNGQRLRENIEWDCETPHFKLRENDRCPFLNGSGLCDLILELGEDSLCGICADHPRFRNSYSDRTEMGLGLSCEEAARIILTNAEPTQLLVLEDDGGTEVPDEEEAYFFSVQANALAIVQDRDFTLAERMENLSDYFGFSLPEADPLKWAEVYLDLERLDEGWTVLLEQLKSAHPAPLSEQWELPFEQLLVYFIYRHLPTALIDGDIGSKLGFAVLSTMLLQWLLSISAELSMETLIELARMYSGEVEYSDENPDILFDILYED